MSGFKDMVAADIHSVFLNLKEFAEPRTIEYNGKRFEDIPIVMTGLKEQDRRAMVLHSGVRDNVQGLYMVTSVLHCAIDDLGGKQPEKGQRIKINHEEGGGGFFSEFYVASSVNSMGMLRVELEAIDE